MRSSPGFRASMSHCPDHCTKRELVSGLNSRCALLHQTVIRENHKFRSASQNNSNIIRRLRSDCIAQQMYYVPLNRIISAPLATVGADNPFDSPYSSLDLVKHIGGRVVLCAERSFTLHTSLHLSS
ncbi:protein of unknown function (plasmid) [Cupriavidus taiwanensis]|uniref:Uncharacterized protein n=1 Tax=Cupriavidus taiwanensis TaxID=164546 RepID=A0A7Z7NQD3_9BURK|nr:hypothetical protein CBM2597_U50031 [Cupriavidus taiwanensis]SOZ97275.1 hypothetical protein CBM2598_U50031 [Cupriavidus taiwanensis]SPC26165.1 hypothetical protein CBM2594_U60031 [Cupriavidus taiwanensis]SPD37702.1 protein of unknown function [Cupriavidus taiwanensis]